METPATTFSPVSKFHFGAAVRDAEGASGALAHVVVAPESHALIAVGVSFGFGPFGHEFYAPVERVVAASDAGIELSATSSSNAGWGAMSSFRRTLSSRSAPVE